MLGQRRRFTLSLIIRPDLANQVRQSWLAGHRMADPDDVLPAGEPAVQAHHSA
jgi:hypothetical protein